MFTLGQPCTHLISHQSSILQGLRCEARDAGMVVPHLQARGRFLLTRSQASRPESRAVMAPGG